jgi:hypothetical protein
MDPTIWNIPCKNYCVVNSRLQSMWNIYHNSVFTPIWAHVARKICKTFSHVSFTLVGLMRKETSQQPESRWKFDHPHGHKARSHRSRSPQVLDLPPSIQHAKRWLNITHILSHGRGVIRQVISSSLSTSPLKWMGCLPCSIFFLQRANLIGQSLRKAGLLFPRLVGAVFNLH